MQLRIGPVRKQYCFFIDFITMGHNDVEIFFVGNGLLNDPVVGVTRLNMFCKELLETSRGVDAIVLIVV